MKIGKLVWVTHEQNNFTMWSLFLICVFFLPSRKISYGSGAAPGQQWELRPVLWNNRSCHPWGNYSDWNCFWYVSFSPLPGKSHMAVVQHLVNNGNCDPYYEIIGVVTLEEIIQTEIVSDMCLFLPSRKVSYGSGAAPGQQWELRPVLWNNRSCHPWGNYSDGNCFWYVSFSPLPGKSHMAVVQHLVNNGNCDPYYEIIGVVTLEEIIQTEIVSDMCLFLPFQESLIWQWCSTWSTMGTATRTMK